MTDRKLFIEVSYDANNYDATIVLWRDRPPLPVDVHVMTLSGEHGEPPLLGWDGVRDVLVSLVEGL